MNHREKLQNLNTMLDTLIDTCKSEIKITEKFIINAKDKDELVYHLKEKAFWEGKLEVAMYSKHFSQ